MPPNPEVSRLERNLAHKENERAGLYDYISNRFTPLARNDLISEIRFVTSQQSSENNKRQQLRQLLSESRNARDREGLERRKDTVEGNLRQLEVRHANAKRRLDEYDQSHQGQNQKLARLDGEIRGIRQSLSYARAQHRR